MGATCQGQFPTAPAAGLQLLGSSRGISVGMAPSHSAKACQAVAEKAEIDIFVVDSDKQLQKVIQVSPAGQ